MTGTDGTDARVDPTTATEPARGSSSTQEAVVAVTDAEPTDVAVTAESGRESELPPLAPGTQVEVRSSFERTWSKGFEVVEATEAGYRIRRLSDGSTLPGHFARTDLRRERRGGTWWY